MMVWVFAILIVLALGGVAAVASGRGTPMAPAYDDRPDVEVPEAGEITGEDLRHVRFNTAVRGYHMDEVDELLARLAAQLDAARVALLEGEPDELTKTDLDDAMNAGDRGTPPAR